MSVKLIYSSPVWLIANGIRYSHDNHHLSDSFIINYTLDCPKCGSDNNNFYGNSLICEDCGFNLTEHIGSKDFNLIKKVGFKMKHESVLEHSLIVFEFEASRALLQELSRSRIGVSPTVKSTRYVLKKDLKNETSFISDKLIKNWLIVNGIDGTKKWFDIDKAKKYIFLTGDDDIDACSIQALENVRFMISRNKSNDVTKYAIPESMLFKGQYSMNLRALVHLLELRTNKDVLPEFQQLCKDIIDVLPDNYRELVLTNEKIRTNYERIKNENC